MAQFTEGKYPGDWLKWEADANYSREEITVAAGSGADRVLTSGMVLAKVTKGAAATAAAGAAVGGNTGDGTITGKPVVGAAAKVGVYTITCIEPATGGGTFSVEDPDGITIGVAGVGVEFTTHLTFTIAAGSTDFVAGDQFTITVPAGAAGSGEWVQYDEDGSATGTSVPAGILLLDVTAPDGVAAKGVAIVRNAIVNPDQLTWPATAEAAEKLAALAVLKSLGIIAGKGV